MRPSFSSIHLHFSIFFFETSGVIFNNLLLLKTCVKSLKKKVSYDELNSRQCGLLLQLDNSRWDVVKY